MEKPGREEWPPGERLGFGLWPEKKRRRKKAVGTEHSKLVLDKKHLRQRAPEAF